MDSLEQISDVSSGVIDLSMADTDSTSGNKTKDTSLDGCKGKNDGNVSSVSTGTQSSSEKGQTWIENKMKDMEMITDETFEFDLPGLEDFLDLSCSRPVDVSSSDSSFASSYDPELSVCESLRDINEDADTVKRVEGDFTDSGENSKEPKLQVEDVLSQKEQPSEIADVTDCHENSTQCEEEPVSEDSQHKPKTSKLPTPSQSFKNCSTFTRSPVKCTQLEEIKAVQGLIYNDSNTVLTNLNNHTSIKDEPRVEIDSSGRSSSNASSSDACIISRSSSVCTVVSIPTSEGKSNDEEMNESMTSVVSEASSIGSSLESRESGKAVSNGRGLRLSTAIGARAGKGIPTKLCMKTRLKKPSTRKSLLPSKAIDTNACKKVPLKATLLQKPQVGDKVDGPIKKSLQPIGRNSKLTTNLFRENRGDSKKISRPISTSSSINSSTPTSFNSKSRRVPNGKRLRKTSIPRPASLSNLRKNAQVTSSNSATATGKVLVSTFNIHSSSIVNPEPSSTATDKVIQSTPIKPLVTETPNRRRSVVTTTPSQTMELVDPTPGVRPSFSLSSTESSVSEKSVSDAPMKNPHGNASAVIEGGVMKTPRTVTKRRSFIPTPGGIEKSDPIPFNLDTSMKKAAQDRNHPASESAKENCMPPPKRQLNPKAKNSGLQKPSLGGPRSRIAFKPRNGQLARVKNGAPFKAKPFSYGDDFEIASVSVPRSKVVHSPVNKENMPGTPHSEWSPVRKKKPLSQEESCYQCTKRIQ